MARVKTRLLQTSVTLNARSISRRLNASVTAISRGFEEWVAGDAPPVPPTPPTPGTEFLIADEELDIVNRNVVLSFYIGIYHSSGGGVVVGDFTLFFVKDGTGTGNATNCTVSSITKTDGSALTGGEQNVLFNLSLTGSPNGFETIEITPSAAGSFKDGAGAGVSAADTTQPFNLELTYDPWYEAGLVAALTASINPPAKPLRLEENTVLVSLRAQSTLTENDYIRFSEHTNAWMTVVFRATSAVTGSFTGTVTITPFNGGIASAGGYFDTAYAPATHGVKWLLNDSACIVLVANNATSANVMFGAKGSAAGVNRGHVRMIGRTSGNTQGGAMNANISGNSTVPTGVTDSTGVQMLSREASNLTRHYLNGTQLITAATVSSELTTRTLKVWAIDNDGTVASSDVAHQIMMIMGGAGQQDKVTEISTILNTFKTNVQAMTPSFGGRVYLWMGQSNMGSYGHRLLTELDASQNALYNHGPYSMANGYAANVYTWNRNDGEIQFLEPGVNGVNDAGGTLYFSPIFPYAKAQADAHPGENLFFVSGAYAGSGMYQGDFTTPGWIAGGPPSSVWVKTLQDYNNLIANMTTVTAYRALFGQGETDAAYLSESNAYEARLGAFAAQVFANTGATSLIVAKLNDDASLTKCPYRDTVRTAQVNNVGNFGPAGVLVSTDAIPFGADGGIHWLTLADGITFGILMSTNTT